MLHPNHDTTSCLMRFAALKTNQSRMPFLFGFFELIDFPFPIKDTRPVKTGSRCKIKIPRGHHSIHGRYLVSLSLFLFSCDLPSSWMPASELQPVKNATRSNTKCVSAVSLFSQEIHGVHGFYLGDCYWRKGPEDGRARCWPGQGRLYNTLQDEQRLIPSGSGGFFCLPLFPLLLP